MNDTRPPPRGYQGNNYDPSYNQGGGGRFSQGGGGRFDQGGRYDQQGGGYQGGGSRFTQNDRFQPGGGGGRFQQGGRGPGRYDQGGDRFSQGGRVGGGGRFAPADRYARDPDSGYQDRGPPRQFDQPPRGRFNPNFRGIYFAT